MEKPTNINKTIPAVSDPTVKFISNPMQYAGWILRTGAFILDVILCIILAVVLYFFSPDKRLLEDIFGTILGCRIHQVVTVLLIPIFFYVVPETCQGGSLGKKVFGLRVASTKGTKLSWGRALGRVCTFALVAISTLGVIDVFLSAADAYGWEKLWGLKFTILLLIPGIISSIPMIFSATKQTCYDKWFGSVVLSTREENIVCILLALAEMVFVGFVLFLSCVMDTYHGHL